MMALVTGETPSLVALLVTVLRITLVKLRDDVGAPSLGVCSPVAGGELQPVGQRAHGVRQNA